MTLPRCWTPTTKPTSTLAAAAGPRANHLAASPKSLARHPSHEARARAALGTGPLPRHGAASSLLSTNPSERVRLAWANGVRTVSDWYPIGVRLVPGPSKVPGSGGLKPRNHDKLPCGFFRGVPLRSLPRGFLSENSLYQTVSNRIKPYQIVSVSVS